MKRVVFLQGGGAGARAEDAALAEDLATRLGPDYRVDFPAVADEDDPDFANWSAAIATAVELEPVALVGHSLGGYFLLKWLAENPAPSVRVVALVAAPYPSADADWTFAGFELPADVGDRVSASVFLYASEDDDIVPFAHRDFYARALPAARARTTSGGHQLGGDLSMVADDIRAALERR